jgi:hypothetical protein
MPLHEEKNWGTNSDGTLTDEFCKFCFADGDFTNPERTMEEQIEIGVKMSMKMWMPEDKAREIANNSIPKLKRWCN